MAHVAEAVAAGDLGLDVAAGAACDQRRDVADADRVPRGHVVGAVVALGLLEHRPQRGLVGARDVVDVHEVAHLPAVLEDLGRLAALERGAEHRRHPRVGRVARHPGAVDVVVAQRQGRGAGLAHPGDGVVLLGDLAGGVAGARLEARVLVDQRPGQRLAADRAGVLEAAGLQRLAGAGGRHLLAVLGAGVATLAVDDHARGLHQPVHARLVHRREQHRRAQVVVARVERQVGDGDAGPDHGGLVAHHVDPAQQVGPRVGVAHVELVGAGGGAGRAVGLLEHQVDAHHLVAGGLEALGDGAADEAGRSGQQDLHRAGTW